MIFVICHDIEYSSLDSKWFLAMGVRRFTNAPFNHFKAMFSLIFIWLPPFPKNAPVQSHSHSFKNPTSRLPPDRDVGLTRLVIANQIKWCDITACRTPTIQLRDNLVGSYTNSKPMLCLQKHVTSGINQPLIILTKFLSYIVSKSY